MVGVHKRRDTWVSTSDCSSRYNDDGEEIPKSYCPSCESFGFYNLLKERIYTKEERVNNGGQKPRDSENWLQCWVCGEIVAIVHAKQESSLVGIKDVPDTIYDIKRLYVEHFIKPRSATIRKNIKQVHRSNPEEEDTGIKSRVEEGERLISYETSER